MTQAIDFHTGVADKLGYACRLLRKALRAGKQVVVTGQPAELQRLDQLLWTFEPGEFIPHARLRAGQAIAPVLARTPLWLADQAADAGVRDVLVNLGPQALPDTAAWPRVIEIVADGPDEVAAGRERWRQYKAAGLSPRAHAQTRPEPGGQAG
ncbi:DNA polymerase III subunit chi [Ideonella sp. DXS22W]|uniref:DNA polymerase III subunit chi n=1 Tax=Pseudaquabacterium inlustre TaxID=2984192 RepID=A0ABU9CNQ1_9BURK